MSMNVNLDTPVPWYRLQAWAAGVKIANAFGLFDEETRNDVFDKGKITNRFFANAYHEIETKPPDFPINLFLPILKMPAISAAGTLATISGGLWYFWSHFNKAAKWIGGIAAGLGVAGIATGYVAKSPMIGSLGSGLTGFGVGALIPGIFHNAFKYIGGTVAGIGVLTAIVGAFTGFRMKPEIMKAYRAELNTQPDSPPPS